jgi:large subunit ribosomal protein L19
MDTKLLEKVTGEYKKVKHPNFRIGDVIEVYTKIKEEDKERVQVFKGIVISIKGSGVSKTFTVRKISYSIGVEKIFPFFSPVIEKIKIIKQAKKIKRSKLYYLRQRVGKRALKAGIQVPAEGENLETEFEEEVKEEEAKSKVKSKRSQPKAGPPRAEKVVESSESAKQPSSEGKKKEEKDETEKSPSSLMNSASGGKLQRGKKKVENVEVEKDDKTEKEKK